MKRPKQLRQRSQTKAVRKHQFAQAMQNYSQSFEQASKQKPISGYLVFSKSIGVFKSRFSLILEWENIVLNMSC